MELIERGFWPEVLCKVGMGLKSLRGAATNLEKRGDSHQTYQESRYAIRKKEGETKETIYENNDGCKKRSSDTCRLRWTKRGD